MFKLDFGSGYSPTDGYFTCDIEPAFTLDYLYNIEQNKIIGINDSSVDCIKCRNVIHHVQDLGALVLEFKRILKTNGIIEITEPNELSYDANNVLDYVWYRYIIPRYNIWFSPKYREYRKIFSSQFNETSYIMKNEKEMVIYRN